MPSLGGRINTLFLFLQVKDVGNYGNIDCRDFFGYEDVDIYSKGLTNLLRTVYDKTCFRSRKWIIKYDGKEYYFVIDKMDDSGKIVSWHFAYDSDLTYVFKDSKYWVLTVLTIGLSLSVYRMNAQSTLRKVQDSDGSQKTRMVYAKQKSEIMDDVEYLDYFLEDEFAADTEPIKLEELDNEFIVVSKAWN